MDNILKLKDLKSSIWSIWEWLVRNWIEIEGEFWWMWGIVAGVSFVCFFYIEMF